MNLSSIYYPNLTAIRGIAASLVFFHHYNQIASLLNRQHIPFVFLNKAGDLGVLLFFVLSGFLITSLLITEKEKFGSIDAYKFYIRRILRIWPLYYLLLIFGFFVFPNIGITALSTYNFKSFDFIAFMFFGAKYILNIGVVIPGIAPLWSVCVEEWFYFIWPWLTRNLFIFIFLAIMFIFLPYTTIIPLDSFNLLKNFLIGFYKLFPFDGMACGGLFAILLYYKKQILNSFLFTPLFQVLILIFLVFAIVLNINIPVIERLFYSLIFSYLIINVALNPNNVIRLENIIINKIGKVSYGIYMFHSAIIFIIFFLISKLNTNSISYFLNSVYVNSIIIYLITILFSILSFNFFETRFLNYKLKFTKLNTKS